MLIHTKSRRTKSSKSNRLRYRNTYSTSNDNSESAEEDSDTNIQKKVVKQESMLQVSYRNKKYKNWLFDLMKWLMTKNSVSISGEEVALYLDNWILNNYNRVYESLKNAHISLKAKNKVLTDYNYEALGTDTPHFIFNFIDYLYWMESRQPSCGIRYIEDVHDFNFRYYNSVEHHLPQSYVNTETINVDNIGNLCLISRRKNSSLNDKAPKEKAVIASDLQPKRRVMYTITKANEGRWDQNEITEHFKDIQILLDSRYKILGIEKGVN